MHIWNKLLLIAMVLLIACPLFAADKDTADAKKTVVETFETATLSQINRVTALPNAISADLRKRFNLPRNQPLFTEVADRGTPFRRQARSNPKLPLRRMMLAGTSEELAMVAYERGGVTGANIVLLYQKSGDAWELKYAGYFKDRLNAKDIKGIAWIQAAFRRGDVLEMKEQSF